MAAGADAVETAARSWRHGVVGATPADVSAMLNNLTATALSGIYSSFHY